MVNTIAYVAFLVPLPRNKGYYKSHLSISTLRAILLSILHEVKNYIDSFGFSIIIRAYTSTKGCTVEGIRER